MSNYASAVITIALNEVGYLEKKSNSQLDSKTANAGSNNYTKYGRDMHQIYPTVMDFPAYWCDSYVDWCFYKAYGVANAKGLLGGNFDDYTVASAQLYKNKKAYYKSNPKVGDQIFFNNGTRICHTGLVYAVDASKVYTVEGNTSGGSTVIANGGSVAKKSYALNYKRIDGYGRPKYDSETRTSTTPSSPTATPQSNQTQINYAVQVWINEYLGGKYIATDGIFGTNSKRYLNVCLERALGLSTRNGVLSSVELSKLTYSGVKSSKELTKVLESYLFVRGYNPQEYSGVYNDSVVNAVRKFQIDMKIGVDGKAGKGTFCELVY